MDKVTIAFDIDGTLLDNDKSIPSKGRYFTHQHIADLLRILSKFKNVKTIAWSARGEQYARDMIAQMNLRPFVKGYASKGFNPIDGSFNPDVQPDIAIDDVQSCSLGTVNLIVRNK